MYVFGKIVAFFVRPFSWLLLLLLLALWDGRRRKRWLLACLGLVLIMGNGWLVNEAARWWEYPPRQPEGHYDIAIVLGGYMSEPGLLSTSLPESQASIDRLLAALPLLADGQADKLVLSAGSADIWRRRVPEAQVVGSYLRSIGIPDSVLILEDKSINTLQNAQFTRDIVQQMYPQGARCLLITSAWHMRRAVWCFEQAGLAVDVYPVDYLQWRVAPGWRQYWLPGLGAWQQWEYLLKEWVGLAGYKMRAHFEK
jgi:uncharacterized SAM-binding protein YcdF (DUF218 family)